MPSVRAPLSLLAKSNNQPFCFRFLSLLLNVTVALFLDRVRSPRPPESAFVISFRKVIPNFPQSSLTGLPP
jgi:hypothetical protein